MTASSAKTIVLVTAGVMFAVVGLKRSSLPDPFRYAWAAGVITLGLSVVADVAPEIAGPFAVLLLMAVWYRNRSTLGTLNPAGAGPNITTGGVNSPDNRAGPKGPGGTTSATSTEAPGFPGR